MRQIAVLTLTDLRQRVRDPSVIAFALVVPFALMFVFNLVFGATDELELDAVTVAVAAPADDEMAAIVVDAVRQLDGELFAVTVEASDAAGARARVDDGDAAVSLVFPEGFGAAARGGTPVTVDAVRGDELEDWLEELHHFDGSEGGVDDFWDATADAYDQLVNETDKTDFRIF